jgi:hypothetical protein
MKQFEATTAEGKLWAGEVALEEAYKAGTTDKAAGLFSYAQNMFNKAYYDQRLVWPDRYDPISARARIQAANMPIHRFLFFNQLPPNDMVKDVYCEVVNVCYALAEEHRAKRPSVDIDSRHEISGAIGEYAILALSLRDYIVGDEQPKLFPQLAMYTEDRRNSHGSSINHGWDISEYIMTGSILSLGYRLQVKTSDYRRVKAVPDENGNLPNAQVYLPNESGISMVFIDPDLKLEYDRFHLSSVIIRECLIERIDPAHAAAAVERLNQRTKQLRATIGITGDQPSVEQ